MNEPTGHAPADPAPLGTRSRGRPRDPETDAAILSAGLELFIEAGAEGASMQRIAERAGVGKLTVYRRWSTKEELLAQAIESARGEEPSLDPEDLRGLSVAEAVERGIPLTAAALARPEFRAMLAQTLGSTQTHPRIMAAYWEHYILPRRRATFALLERARHDGALGADTDLDVLVDMMVGAIIYRVLRPGPLSEEQAARFLRTVYRQAGLLPAEH